MEIKGESEFLPPANEVCEGYVFTGVCLSTGEASVAGGGRAWQRGHLWQGVGCTWQGGMHDRGYVLQGACMAGETAAAVGGTHPTGIHSCSLMFFTFPSAFPRSKCTLNEATEANKLHKLQSFLPIKNS